MVESFDEYYETRFTGQQEWYSQKATWNKQWYIRLRVAVVVIAALIPLTISIIGTASTLTAPLLYSLSLLLITTEAILSSLNLQENWINYRTTSEALKKEREFFRTRTGPYHRENTDNPETRFVERVEELISSENRVWRVVTDQDREKPRAQ
jgi:hypothetical protein